MSTAAPATTPNLWGWAVLIVLLGAALWVAVAIATALVLGPVLRRLGESHPPAPSVGSATTPAPSSTQASTGSVASATPRRPRRPAGRYR